MFGKGSLSDVRVLDLTQMLAGPFCTQVLADHGATVIKIEPPGGDGIRAVGPFLEGDEVRAFGGYFQSINRNKASIVLDLKNPEAREVFMTLVATSDVVVENFRAGVMERLNLSYEALADRNPAVIYATVRGFGDSRTGRSPYFEWPAYDVVAQAMGGIMGITGPNETTPIKIGPGVGDTVPALMLTIGILSALHHVKRTGNGQFVDVSMVDSVLAICERIIYQYSYQGRIAKPEGNHHPLICPFGLFPCANGFVALSCASDALWCRLAEAIGQGELAHDPRFATNAARIANASSVVATLEGFTRPRTKDEIKTILGGIVPFGPVYDARDIFEDLHFMTREMIVDLDHPGSDRCVRVAGVPIKLSKTPGGVGRRAPMLGEHTDQILEAAGYSRPAIANMRRSGAVA
jgi:crotonobetainyl-CoA:carnitine CoA-transferase CaiB-like acyl-CoA transferase